LPPIYKGVIFVDYLSKVNSQHYIASVVTQVKIHNGDQ